MIEQRDRFEALVTSERPRLIARAQRVLRDRDEAEDVVQETLTAVWRMLADNPPRHLRGYLYRAVELNAIKRRARRRQYPGLEPIDETIHAAEKEDEPWDIDPFTLEQAMLGLPANQQVVLRLKYYVGLTFREIGDALSISSNTAASRCRYALDRLRQRLKKV